MILYSGVDLDGGTVGRAFIGAICGSHGVGLIQDTRRSVHYVGAIMAHEIGHLFNMDHDDGSEYTYIVFTYMLMEHYY